MKLKVVQYIALLMLLLVTGVFWGTWFALSRSIDSFSYSEFIHIGKIIIENLAVPMRIIMPACILFMVLSIPFYTKKQKSMGFYLIIFAAILILVVLYITVGIEVPMDNEIKQWTPLSPPPDWEAIRTKWEFFHTMRTVISLISFACFSASLQFEKGENSRNR
ncbi:MAG TPA: DUF1772 domain-containing protein [Bacteroidia bacterium]|jgi:uncharacterized membrane protein|nr:DUF1772 domain-containing protein [Bacteroidia bacterium]